MKKKTGFILLMMLLCILIGLGQYNVSLAADDQEAVKELTIGSTTKNKLQSESDDYYSFTPTETGELTITIKSETTAAFTATILDETHINIYRTKSIDYDITKDTSVLKYVVYVNPMTYHLKVSKDAIASISEYTVTTSFKSLSDSTEGKNNSKDTAAALKNNKYYVRYMTIDENKDYYKMTVKDGGKLKFQVNCYSKSSISVDVVNEAGQFVAQTGAAGFNNYSYAIDQSVPAGTYTVIIEECGTSTEEGNKYSIATGSYVVTKKLEAISKKTMYVGKTYQLKVTRTPEDSSEKLTYQSSNKKVVTVSSSGKLTAKGKGTATITVTGADSKIKVKVKITVKEIAVTKVKITTASKSIYVGAKLQLKAKVTPSDATKKTVTWKSSDTSVATVNKSGKVTAKKAGKCTITATAGGKKATYQLTVKVIPVSSVTLNRSSLSMTEGNKATLTATVKPSNAGNKKVTYKSSNTSVATVDSKGNVTAKSAGKAVITATAGGKKDTCSVTVTAKAVVTPTPTTTPKPTTTPTPTAVEIKSITLESSVRLTVGDTKKLSISVSPSNADASGLKWKSSDSSIVSVSNGTITGEKEGYATIVVEAPNGAVGMCTVTVSK